MAKGYIQDSKGNFEHRNIWEKRYGKIPKGYFIHHINGNKKDNRIENFKLVTMLEHKRIHTGCVLVDGVWWKTCSICHEKKPINSENWILKKTGTLHDSFCRKCNRIYIRKWVAKNREEKNKLFSLAKDESYDYIYECPKCKSKIFESNFCPNCGKSLRLFIFIKDKI